MQINISFFSGRRRIRELLEANNREVERRREAELETEKWRDIARRWSDISNGWHERRVAIQVISDYWKRLALLWRGHAIRAWYREAASATASNPIVPIHISQEQ